MELQGIGSSSFPLKDIGIQTGQKILIEVLSRDVSGKAQIRIAGQEISALLEIPVEAGDKFWAGVQKIDESGVLLVREKKLNQPIKLSIDQQGMERLNVSRGKFEELELTPMLKLVLEKGLNQNTKDGVGSFFQDIVPQWSTLGEKDGYKLLAQLIKGFGFDYERRIRNLGNLPKEEQIKEQADLSKTLKGILLSTLSNESEAEGKSLLTNLLERLTGQQVWLQGASPESPFYLFEFPIRHEGEVYAQRLAIKAARRGNKVDLGHCRVALHAQAPTLGEIGIEGWLYEGQLTVKALSENPGLLSNLIEENFSAAHEQFKRLGIHLHPVSVDSLRTAEEFHRFLRGELREGVDFQV